VTWVSCRFPGGRSLSNREGVGIIRLGTWATAHIEVFNFVKHAAPDVIIDDLAHVVPWCPEKIVRAPGTAFFRHLHRRTLGGQVAPPLAAVLRWIESQYPRIYPSWPFVTESKQSFDDLVELGLHPSRVVKIPPGVDSNRFHPAPKSLTPTIVYFGGFREYKRPWIPLEVLKRIGPRFPGLKLIMVGTGPDWGRVERLSRALPATAVEFTGRLGDEELVRVVSSAWLNLHCSVSEGWGLSILESSAAGTPTVAFSVPGVAETVEVGRNGITVEDGNVDALAEATANVLLEPTYWISSSRAVAERYSWESSTDRWEAHLRTV
jgi:glycosyltransferase involved in cell wall biosynthesis